MSGPANGTLTLNADGSFSYTPNANFNGSDSFSYRASDGTLTSAATVVTITVNPVNDPPVVNAGSDVSVVFPAAASLAGTAVDLDGPALVRVWSQVSGPGTAMFADPNAAATTVTFTVPGTYVLRLSANDGQFTVSDDVTVAVNLSNTALRLDGVSKRVTFGAAPALGAATFTIETWFKREGPGVSLSTGSGGLPAAIPLVTKGRGEADGSNLDMNYFLGISGTSRVLVADFEDTATGLNHPVQGVTAICDNVWYHAAATYDGTTWRLYLNGQLETTLVVGAFTPRADSIQHAGLGTAMTSTGSAAGFFQGLLDEPRVWNVARSGAAIQAAMTGPLASAPGLIGRWSLDEGSGSTAADSSGGGTTGTVLNTAVWVAGTPYVSTPLPAGNYALRLTGLAADAGHVKLGAAPGLGASTFTIETWFKREAAGVATNTGAGGVVAIPLVTKGMAETEGGTVDMNYFLGIRQTDNVLVADFEDTATALNHPVAGITPIPVDGVWHHAAATYDGTTWRLYLDGALQTQLVVGAFTPRADSIQHAAIGSALNSTGGVGSQTQGFFGGALDEVRIWNVARSAAQILAGKDQEIATAAGLLGRWGFNDSCGGVLDSSGNNQHGTLSGANCTFVAGAPFTSTPNTAPVVNAGADQGVTLPAAATLNGTATDDGLPGAGLTTTWTRSSGPGTVTFGNVSALSTTASFSVAGTYVLRLTASDSLLSTFDELTVTVAGAVNQAPVVNAGLDQTIALPINQVSLAGTATDDGLPSAVLTTTWSKVSGPGTVTFGNPALLGTSATFSLQGTYVLQLAASDGSLSSTDTLSVTVSPNAAEGAAVDFGGTNAYVTFGAAPGLGASTFTIETWFKRDGAGIATNTGTGGVVAVPLVTKGMAEAEGGPVDMNYFLGIRGTDNVLVADFEDTATGLNHPVIGTTAIPSDGVWRHAAATYDGTTWRLYLDGTLQAQLVVGAFTPQFNSIQHAALGTALNSTGGVGTQTQGFFNGALDEARVWNYARSAAQISRGRQIEIASAPGLKGRWSFSETSGTTVGDSSGNNITGTIVGTNWTRVSGAPFTPPGNTAPVAASDEANTNRNTATTIAILANDADADGDTLSVTAVTAPAHGTAVANANGTVLYTPALDYSGADSFGYSISDNQGGVASATVSVTVAGSANLAPTANAGADETITFPINVVSLAGTASDDGVPGPGLTTTWSKISGPGTVTFGNAAALSTDATFSAPGTYVLQLLASDGLLSASDTVSVTVAANPSNKGLDLGGTNAYVTFGNAPALGVSTLTLETWFRRDGAGIATNTGSGGVVAIPLITKGMAEAEGGSVDMNYFLGIRASDNVLIADFEDTATGANHPVIGTTAVPANGVWHHAAATYDGTTWRLYLDGALQTQLVVGAFTPQFNGIQHAALGTALNSTGGITSGQTQGFFDGVMDEARVWNYARSGQQIGRGSQLEIGSAPGLRGRWGLNEGSGTVIGDSSGNNVTGTLVGSNVAWVAGAPFAGTNAAPVALDDSATTTESAAVTIAVLANDTDGDGDSLAVTTAGTPAHGTASVNPNGTVTYTPAAGFNGIDSFTYAMSDSQGGSANATVDVTISSVNEYPVAVNDSYSTSKNTALTVAAPGVLANDTDGDGDLLMAFVLTEPSHGTLTLNAEGDFTYTPETDYAGADSFTYVIDDGVATSNVGTVTIAVAPTNEAPVAQANSYSTDEDTPLVLAAPGLLANDTDPNSDPLTAVLVSAPGHGSVTVSSNGGFTYTPAADYNGPDSFTYKANDGAADSNVATVSLTVNAVNDAPVAGNDAFAGSEDTNLVVAAPGVLANDADSVEGSSVTAVLVTGPAHGTLTLNGDGSFSYLPAANFNGVDSFSYRASDGDAQSGVATATILVAAMSDAPVAQNDAYTTTEDTTLVTFGPAVLANDSDIDGDPLTAVLVAGPSNGTLSLNANGGFTYTPAFNFSGTDSFTYQATDGPGDSNVATVTITVNAVNDVPVAGNNTYSTSEDVTLVVNVPGVLGNDSDGDGNPLTAIVVTEPTHGTLADGRERRVHVCARGQLQRARQLHLPGLRRHRQLEPRDGDDYGERRERPAGGRGRQLQHERGHAVDGGGARAEGQRQRRGRQRAHGRQGREPGPWHGNGERQRRLHLHADRQLQRSRQLHLPGERRVGELGHRDGDAHGQRRQRRARGGEPGQEPERGFHPGHRPGGHRRRREPADLHDRDAAGARGPDRHGAERDLRPGSELQRPRQLHLPGERRPGQQRNVGTVTLTVTPVNDAPVGQAASFTTPVNTPKSGVLVATDVDGNPLTYLISTAPTKGTVTLNAATGAYTYTPLAGRIGADSFRFRANDGVTNSALTTVSIVIQ